MRFPAASGEKAKSEVAPKKRKGSELSVFKGREARLNRAIFRSLSLQGVQTAYDLHKNMRSFENLQRIHYANVNKRLRVLEKLGYVKRKGTRRTKAGFEATIFEVATKAHLAILINSICFDDLLDLLSEGSANALMAIFAASE